MKQRWSICVDVGASESAVSELYDSIREQTVQGGECLLIAWSVEQQQRLQRNFRALDTQVLLAPNGASWLQRFRVALSYTSGNLVLCLGADWRLHQRTMEYVLLEASRYARADFWTFTRQAWFEHPGVFLSSLADGAVPGMDDGRRLTYLDLLLYGPFLRFCSSVWRRDCLERYLTELSLMHVAQEDAAETVGQEPGDFQVMLTAARLGYVGIGISEVGPIERSHAANREQAQYAIWQQRVKALQGLEQNAQAAVWKVNAELADSYRFAISRALQDENPLPGILCDRGRNVRPTANSLLSYIIVAGEKLWPIEDTLRSLLGEENLAWEAVVVFPPQVRSERWLRTLDPKQRLRALNLNVQCTMGAAFNAGFMVARGSQCVFLRAGTKAETGHARAVMAAPQRTLQGQVGCAMARLVILERDLSNGWISERAFVAPQELALDWSPGVPLDALSFHRAEFLQRGPFVTDPHHFPGWDMLLRRPRQIYPLPTSVDVSVRVGSTHEDFLGNTILATVDRHYARYPSNDAKILERRRSYRHALVDACTRFQAAGHTIEHIEAWYKSISGIMVV